MRPTARLSFASCVVAAGLALGACGGGGPGGAASGAATTVSSGPGHAVTRHAGRPNAADRRPAARAGSPCQAQVGGFLSSLDALRRRLAVGVTYEQYVEELHAVGDTYRKIPVQALAVDCLAAAGAPAERAFNRYIAAANRWGECVSESGCDSGRIEPLLQRRWKIASHQLSEAERGLAATGT